MKNLDDARRSFCKFEEFTRRLIAVPRLELGNELAAYEPNRDGTATCAPEHVSTEKLKKPSPAYCLGINARSKHADLD